MSTPRKRPEDKLKTGRPTKKTDGNRETILAGVRAGLYPETAAGVAGVARSTLGEWRSEDPEFSAAIEAAEAEAEARKVGHLEKQAVKGSIKALTWLLERRNANHYGKRLNLGGADGGPLTIRVVYEDGQPEESE